jgi:hypothetical protein
MKRKLPRYLSFEDHLALGVTIAWVPSFTHHVIWAALSDFMRDFGDNGIAAWERFVSGREGNPYPVPEVGLSGEGVVRQQELERRYLSEAMPREYRR